MKDKHLIKVELGKGFLRRIFKTKRYKDGMDAADKRKHLSAQQINTLLKLINNLKNTRNMTANIGSKISQLISHEDKLRQVLEKERDNLKWEDHNMTPPI